MSKFSPDYALLERLEVSQEPKDSTRPRGLGTAKLLTQPGEVGRNSVKLPVSPQMGPCGHRVVITFQERCSVEATGLWQESIKCQSRLFSDCVNRVWKKGLGPLSCLHGPSVAL